MKSIRRDTNNSIESDSDDCFSLQNKIQPSFNYVSKMLMLLSEDDENHYLSKSR